MASYPSIRLDGLPPDVIQCLCQSVLDRGGRESLMHLGLVSARFFAPTIRLAIATPSCAVNDFDTSGPGESNDPAGWWRSHLGLFVVGAKFVDDEARSDDDGDVPMADPWSIHLILPARTAKRRIMSPSDLGTAHSTISSKWSTVPIPGRQLRHASISAPVARMRIGPACHRLSICGNWDDFGSMPTACPATVKTLTLSGFPLSAPMGFAVAGYIANTALTELTLQVTAVLGEQALYILYEHLPGTLMTLKIIDAFPRRFARFPAGRQMSGSVLARIIGMKFGRLTAFQHDFLVPDDVVPIIRALAALPAGTVRPPIRFVKLRVLLLPTTLAPNDTASVFINRVIEHLDVHILSEFHSDANFLTTRVLALLPAPSRVLRLTINEWTDTTASPLAKLYAALSLEEVHLAAPMPHSALNGSIDPPRLLASSLGITQLPRTLSSLSLTGCLSSRLLSKHTCTSWMFPPTVKRLDLSENGLTTGDLIFLQPRLQPPLQYLDLSSNLLHAVVTPLPDSLRVLNVSMNPAMREDLRPDRWILTLPSGLRELNVESCQLPTHVGPILVRARAKGGPRAHLGGMRLQIRAGGNADISEEVLSALIDEKF